MNDAADLVTPPFRYRLEATKIREFARALGGLHEIHVDTGAARSAGYRDVVAPVGFLVWTLVQDRDEVFRQFGLSDTKGLAASEGWDFLAPVCAGDVLSGQTRHTGSQVVERRSGPMILHRLETIYENQFDRIAVIERTTIAQWTAPPHGAMVP